MGSLSLKKKLSNSLSTVTGGLYYIVFKGPAGTTLGNFFNVQIAYLINSTGIYNFFFNNNLNSPSTFLVDEYHWYNSSFNIADNYQIPIGTIIAIQSDFTDYTINFNGNFENYYQGKTSIKKQNLTKLRSLDFDPNGIYTFKSATTNLLGTIFNQAQFEPYSDSLTIRSDINAEGEIFLTDGSNWIYDDFTTNADNYVIPENYILIFSSNSNIDITVGGGAIIQKYYGGKLNLN